ncbi:bifunctional class I SAM-dependent methyltransferase/DEAD/DEAH box helicase [Hyphomicrobium sp. B1]|uniref:strawberry notch-like NTP hydrolase domain-containing protein n=1 Tax=Hyphomicrobium sp. B1 TaxID=3075651 RepID=UPI003C30C14E
MYTPSAITTATIAASPPSEAVFESSDAPAIIRAGEILLKTLSGGRHLDATILRSAMETAFGASDASGAWSWKDAYESVEVAQVLFLRKYLPAIRRERSRAAVLTMLEKTAALLPTHTRRSEESVALQQFSTPLELAFLVGEAAGLRADDVVLEPSAGTGQLAVFGAAVTNKLALNEYANSRADILQLLFPGAPLTRFNAEQLHDRADRSLVPTVVLMNPPFSASPHVSGTMAGVDLRHLRSALRRLAPGGRLVAITSFGLTPDDTRYADAFHRMRAECTMQLSAGLDGRLYRRHGTTMETRLQVFDKAPTPPGHRPIRGICATPAELLHLICELPARLPSSGSYPAAPVPPKPAGTRGTTITPSPAPAAGPAVARETQGIELDYEVMSDAQPRATSIDALYEPYAPERIRIPGAAPHPDKIVQSAAMASVLPPIPTYRPHLPDGLVAQGLLSAAQLETIIYAGEAHARHLAGRWTVNETLDVLTATADGAGVSFRRGFFLGDGTGVGKGRQVAGIILDNWLKGRRRALWISKSDKLLEDAQRDWSALMQERLLVVPQDRYRQGKPIKLREGILFTTYATLRSESEGKPSRLQQILDWVGRDFDGVIVFDEAHAMGNAGGSTSNRGHQKASQQGLAGLKLQHALPEARVVYVSATGATTVENLAYAQRLGLWGSDDLPFDTRTSFLVAMNEGGIASTEVLARDLKALGLYVARSLSYEGVVVEMLEHTLTPGQVEIYDEYAKAYQIIHAHLNEALSATGISGEAGECLNKNAKSAARSAFEGNKQRFFNHLITAMKMPTLIADIEAQLRDGHAAVVQLVSTSEALLERRLAELPQSEWDDLNFDVTPREYCLSYLKHSFPVQLYETYTNDEGQLASRPVFDAEGNPVASREAEEMRDDLMFRLSALPPLQSALDQLIHHFGADAVAEVTGRSRRIVRKSTARGEVLAVENRPASSNIGETQAFMDDKKRILVFSDAGGTGRSYHADKGCLNRRKRVHYLLEAGWKADTAIQGLGRSNRTNQAQPPLFRPVATNVRGEKRFLSTIARRLDSLGAITRGERKTGGQGLFRASDNLESVYAWAALRQFYTLIHLGKVACCSLRMFEDVTGLSLTNADSGTLLDDLPPMHTFLNRMLALQIGLQNALFEVFEDLIDGRVQEAIAKGTYEVGLETIRAERLELVGRRVIAVHGLTGAKTEILDIKRRDRNKPLQLAEVLARASEAGDAAVMLVNRKSSRVALQVPTSSLTLDDGTVQQRVRLLRPTENIAVPVSMMEDTHWEATDRATFGALWQAEVDAVPEYVDSRFHMITGLLLPIWKKLPFAHPRVFRFVTDDGVGVLGRLLPPECLDQFDVPDGPHLSAEELWQRLTDGGTVKLEPGFVLKRVRSMGQPRIELQGFTHDMLPKLKAMGLFPEIIAYATRLFLPTGADGPRVLSNLLARHAVVRKPN